MKHTIAVALAASALLAQICASGTDPRPAQADPKAQAPFNGATVQTLMKKLLAKEFSPNREVIVDFVQVPPNTTLERHWHPGEEFHYYLKGDPYVSIRGKPALHMKEGTVGHIPYKAVHTLTTKEAGATIIVFRVHHSGKPMRYLAKPEGKESQR